MKAEEDERLTKEAAEKIDREAAEREAMIAKVSQAAVEAYVAEQERKRVEVAEEARLLKETADKA